MLFRPPATADRPRVFPGPSHPRVAGAAPILVAIAVLASSAWFASPVLAEEQVTLTVLHTTDLHGHLLPEDDFLPEPAPRGLARIASLVRRARAEDPQALLLDAGDCIQGAPLEFVAHTRLSDRPDPMIVAMNALGYSAMAVGNHEYEFGMSVLQAARRDARFPFLSANTLHEHRPAFEPYKVFVVHGVRVGVLGLTTPAIPNWLDPDKYSGLEFEDAVRTAKQWVPVLRERERCDVVVVLTHQGLERDPSGRRESVDQEKDENAGYALASEVPGIDVIILGHTHRVVRSLTVKGVLLTQAGRWAENLGRIQLRMTRGDTRSPWKVESKQAEIWPVTLETPADSTILVMARPYREATRAWLDEPLGKSDGTFDGARGRTEDNALVDLVHAVQLRYGEADVSLAALFNPTARIAAGPVRMRDLAAIYVYENTLYTLEVTGKQLRAALEHATAYFNPYDFGKTDQPLTDPDVQGYNFDMAEGVDYAIDLTQSRGKRIRDLRYLGKPLDDDRVLHLAVNSYRVNGGGGYTMFRGAKVLKKSSQGIRELLARYVREQGTIRPQASGNWRLLPRFVAHPAREAFERLVRRGVWSEDEAARIDPDAKLNRGTFAAWLGRAYGTGADSAGSASPSRKAARPRFGDLPPDQVAAVEAAARAGAFVSERENLLRPLQPLDLWSALDWTVHADAGGALPRSPVASGERAKQPPDAVRRASTDAETEAVRAVLQPKTTPQGGRPRLPAAVEDYALDRDFLDDWVTRADANALTQADGARLLASARYPLVTILWTNDFHGAFESRDRERGTDRPLGSSPVLAAYLERERARNPRGTLLLDGGDLMQGTFLSNLEFGRPVIEQMNRLGYDASAVGNHEFDWTVDTLVARIHEARFPFLAANLFDKKRARAPPWVEPYEIFARRGIHVGVLGFCTVETPSVTLPANVVNFEFREEAPIAREWIPKMRARGADLIVLMGHLPASQDTAWAPIRGELAELGEKVDGEDVLLGGHNHVFVIGEVKDVPTIIAGSHGRAVGRVDLVVDRKQRRVVEPRARLIYTYADAIRPDPRFAAFVDSLATAVKPIAGRVLTDAPEPLLRNRRSESTLGDWVSDVMRARSGADVALQNPGGLRADIDAGPVTVQDVYEVMPFDNLITVVKLTGSQLLDAIEHGVRGGSALPVSGVRYATDPSRPASERLVRLTLADGKPIDPARTYLVATNDFMAQGGDGFTMLAKGKDLRVTSDRVRDALIADCEARARRHEPLLIKLDGRIEILESSTSNTPAGSGSPR